MDIVTIAASALCSPKNYVSWPVACRSGHPYGLADEPEPPKYLIRAGTRAAWRRSWALRQELIKAADARVEATL